MKLENLCQDSDLACPCGHESDEVLGIVTDSGQATDGCMFVCIRGIHTDGHRFISDAVRRGARWIVAEHGTFIGYQPDVVYLFTDNTRRTCAYLFDSWYGHPTRGIKMIGVTGTNGKTTVTHMIHHVLTACGVPTGLIGTIGSRIGSVELDVCADEKRSNMTTPDPEILYKTLAQMKKAGVACAVMEVSSHSLAFDKVSPIRFAVGIFTNLTPEHLDFHRDMEEYANAKARLLAQCEHGIVNADAEYAERMLRHACGKTTCSATRTDADAYADQIDLIENRGISYCLHVHGNAYAVRCNIPAHFTVMNSMQALLAVQEVGIPLTQACDVMKELHGVRGRMEGLPIPDPLGFSVILDYAHTPDALENLLHAVRKNNPKGRIVLLFGCGGDRDRSKRPLMGRIASELADFIILTSDNSRSEGKRDILLEILVGMNLSKPCAIISERAEAIEYAVRTAERGDVLVLAGKGHEEYEIDENGKKPFSERMLVMQACRKRLFKFEGTERNEIS